VREKKGTKGNSFVAHNMVSLSEVGGQRVDVIDIRTFKLWGRRKHTKCFRIKEELGERKKQGKGMIKRKEHKTPGFQTEARKIRRFWTGNKDCQIYRVVQKGWTNRRMKPKQQKVTVEVAGMESGHKKKKREGQKRRESTQNA